MQPSACGRWSYPWPGHPLLNFLGEPRAAALQTFSPQKCQVCPVSRDEAAIQYSPLHLPLPPSSLPQSLTLERGIFDSCLHLPSLPPQLLSLARVTGDSHFSKPRDIFQAEWVSLLHSPLPSSLHPFLSVQLTTCSPDASFLPESQGVRTGHALQPQLHCKSQVGVPGAPTTPPYHWAITPLQP